MPIVGNTCLQIIIKDFVMLDSQPTKTTRTVRIIKRVEILPQIIMVTVPWFSLTCEGPRGEPFTHHFVEDGGCYTCDRWNNPCGHVDMYIDVLLASPITAYAHTR